MDTTRKAHHQAQELTLQYRSRQEALLDDELIEDKLGQLLTFIGHLKRTTDGAAEIRRRVKLFGKCKEAKARLRGNSMPSCAIGWTGTTHGRNRLDMLRGRLAVVRRRPVIDRFTLWDW